MAASTPKRSTKRGEGGDGNEAGDAQLEPLDDELQPLVSASGRVKRQVKRKNLMDEYVLDGQDAGSMQQATQTAVGSTNSTSAHSATNQSTPNRSQRHSLANNRTDQGQSTL
ncbi:hypothetical protein ACM66B_003184 [Microbotryomycetes sp. NB124-2]